MERQRIVIYAKDIARITGRSERYSRHTMAMIRKRLGKQKHQLISVGEFCTYLDLPEDLVLKQLSMM